MKSTVHPQVSAKLEHTKSTNDSAVQRFKATKRLSAEDQRTAAINLGKLAAFLNPDNPSKAVKQIVAEAKMMEVLDKRKRFFRLPNEEAPIAAKDGTYNANPVKYLNLARAAARLSCGSSDRGIQEREEAKAQREVLLGTTFLPAYMPETQAEKSVQALLDEYAVRLAEAIEERTRITELWRALEATPISLAASSEPLPTSVYGLSANFPSQLLQPLFRENIQHAQFEPATYAGDESWAEPTLFLGYLMISYDLYALVIPDDKVDLFPGTTDYAWHEFEACTVARNEWLDSIGFDVSQHCFRDGNVGRDQEALSKVTVGFIHKVGLSVRKGHRGRVEVQLSIWRSIKGDRWDTDFLVSTTHLPGGKLRADAALKEGLLRYVSEQGDDRPVRTVTIGPEFDEKNEDDYPYEHYWEEWGGNCLLANDCSSTNGKPTKVLLLQDRFGPDYWDNEEVCDEYEELVQAEGWIKDQKCAQLLLGSSNMNFVPSITDANPIAGAARAGSVAASIVENARSAAPDNRISQILIERAALTAEAGLTFCDAMIETARSALIKI